MREVASEVYGRRGSICNQEQETAISREKRRKRGRETAGDEFNSHPSPRTISLHSSVFSRKPDSRVVDEDSSNGKDEEAQASESLIDEVLLLEIFTGGKGDTSDQSLTKEVKAEGKGAHLRKCDFWRRAISSLGYVKYESMRREARSSSGHESKTLGEVRA